MGRISSTAALALLILSSALIGCTAAPQTAQLLQRDVLAYAEQSEIADVPFFPQEAFQCGPAALAAVMNFHGVAKTPEQLKNRIFLPDRQGSLQLEIIAASRAQGLLVYPITPTLDALLQEIASGHPVLVLQNLGLDSLPRWHYAVAIGFDLSQQQIVLHSGVSPRLSRPLALFEMTWAKGGHWGVVILPTDRLPATAEKERYLQTASQLEEVGKLKAANKAYRLAVTKWPDSVLTWAALGNSEYLLGSYQDAANAYRRALAVAPQHHATWNNLAYALQGAGCPDQAQKAIACALKQAPASEQYLSSQLELKEMRFNAAPAVQSLCSLPAC
jgi:tetratricopeptide (TPR) repeat protein